MEDLLDFATPRSIAIVIVGCFRQYGFFEYNVKCDDFINIIKNYINNYKNITIGKNNTEISLDNNLSGISMVDSLNKNFIVAVHEHDYKMLSPCNYLFCCILAILLTYLSI